MSPRIYIDACHSVALSRFEKPMRPFPPLLLLFMLLGCGKPAATPTQDEQLSKALDALTNSGATPDGKMYEPVSDGVKQGMAAVGGEHGYPSSKEGFGEMADDFSPFGNAGPLPTFRFKKMPTGPLPAVATPFGLHFELDDPSGIDWAKIGKTPNLKAVSITCQRYTDATLEPLVALPQLVSIDLNFSKVTDAGLKYLGKCKSLESLRISNTKVTDAGLANLAGLENLVRLGLEHTEVTGTGLVALKGLKKLVALNIHHGTDAGMKGVAALPYLKRIILPLDMTDAGFAELNSHAAVEKLDAAGSKVTGAMVSGMPSLKDLNLRDTPTNDAGLAKIKALKSLDGIVLNDTKVTDAGLKELIELPALTHFKIRAVPITDAGLAHLGKYPQLDFLEIDETKITKPALDAFKKEHPKCKVYSDVK